MLGQALGQEERSVEIDGHHPPPVVVIDLVEHLQVRHPRVVHQDVDLARRLPRPVGQAGELLGLGQVLLELPGPAPQRRDGIDHLLRFLGRGPVRDGHVGAALGHGQGNGPANAAAAAGDQGCAARQIEGLLHAHVPTSWATTARSCPCCTGASQAWHSRYPLT